MGKIEVGDIVIIIQIDKNYGNPYVGRKGKVTSKTEQDPMSHYQVELLPEEGKSDATLTLFENEVQLSN